MGFQDNVNVDVRGAAHIAPCTYKTVVLKQNITKQNLNVLTQAMLDEYGANTKFVIKWDYVLQSNIIIPANCILDFDGGSIDKGTYTITLASDTVIIDTIHSIGTTANRPTLVSSGFAYFDTTLGKAIWYNGTGWIDALGNPVDTVYQPKVTGTAGNLVEFDADGNLVGSTSKASDFQSKVTGTEGNFAGFDESGNLSDSGSKPSDFEPAESNT